MMDERKKAELETMEIIEAIRNGKNPNVLLVAAQSYAKGLLDGAKLERCQQPA